MAVDCTFYKHKDFGGDSRLYSLSNSWRYYWVKFGSPLNNEITSFRARASGGYSGNVYGFTKQNFTGDFSSLNIPSGWTSWWSNVGGSMNDDIESALLVNRSSDEFVIELADLVRESFKDQLDAQLQGEDAERSGEPRIYASFWPSHDSDRKFVSIEQDLRIDIPWWPDYDARLRYDVYFYLASPTDIRAYVAWSNTWVEGGVFTGKILDQLHPKVVAGAAQVDSELASQLPLLGLAAALKGGAQHLYLLPGNEPQMPPPNNEFGRTGNANENCSLVLTF